MSVVQILFCLGRSRRGERLQSCFGLMPEFLVSASRPASFEPFVIGRNSDCFLGYVL